LRFTHGRRIRWRATTTTRSIPCKMAILAAGEAGVFEAVAGAQLKPIVASNIADNLRERGMIMVQALRIWLRHRL